MSYKELKIQIAALKEEAERLRQEALDALVGDICARMAEYDLEPEAVVNALERACQVRARTSRAKYRNPETGETWSGKGRKPGWVHQALSQGKSLQDLLID